MPTDWATASIVRSNSFDPWYNLAWEERLLLKARPEGPVLYLWQNQNTVVIGRNQNAWKECRWQRLHSEGGKLARRLSGGGAVYHDLGNLNFTFITARRDYSLWRQLEVILDAVASLGIPAEFSGRNDLLAAGRKFSGNAFYKHGQRAFHHGTILVDVDFGRMGRYLQVSREKMAAKGIASVQSRVVNLREFDPRITVEAVAGALKSSFQKIYSVTGGEVVLDADLLPSDRRLAELYGKYAGWEWRFGQSPSFDLSLEHRFPWGGIELGLKLASGHVSSAQVFSDAMEPHLILALGPALTGCALEKQALAAAIAGIGDNMDLPEVDGDYDEEHRKRVIEDLQNWLRSLEL